MTTDILTLGVSLVGTTIVWLSGYVTGLCVGKASKKDYGFEKATNQAIETAKETLEIAKKLQNEKDDLQKENDLLKEQLNQDEQCQSNRPRSSDGANPKRDH